MTFRSGADKVSEGSAGGAMSRDAHDGARQSSFVTESEEETEEDVGGYMSFGEFQEMESRESERRREIRERYIEQLAVDEETESHSSDSGMAGMAIEGFEKAPIVASTEEETRPSSLCGPTDTRPGGISDGDPEKDISQANDSNEDDGKSILSEDSNNERTRITTSRANAKKSRKARHEEVDREKRVAKDGSYQTDAIWNLKKGKNGLHSRPPGRPPIGMVWDPREGRYSTDRKIQKDKNKGSRTKRPKRKSQETSSHSQSNDSKRPKRIARSPQYFPKVLKSENRKRDNGDLKSQPSRGSRVRRSPRTMLATGQESAHSAAASRSHANDKDNRPESLPRRNSNRESGKSAVVQNKKSAAARQTRTAPLKQVSSNPGGRKKAKAVASSQSPPKPIELDVSIGSRVYACYPRNDKWYWAVVTRITRGKCSVSHHDEFIL